MRTSLAIAVVLSSLLAGCGPTIGDPCTTNSECGPGVICLNKDFSPGGYCTLACKVEDPNTTCPTGSTCVRDALARNAPACFRTCSRAADCRNGYVCRTVNGSVSICVGAVGF
ncbi:MAG: Extracellular serine protease [Myxococcaceae bacterium]|nr:Extracellular serine protease [Myxococcaceae bacterium]